METKKTFLKPCITMYETFTKSSFLINTSQPGANMSGGNDEVKQEFGTWEESEQPNFWYEEDL